LIASLSRARHGSGEGLARSRSSAAASWLRQGGATSAATSDAMASAISSSTSVNPCRRRGAAGRREPCEYRVVARASRVRAMEGMLGGEHAGSIDPMA
jgi:hypothetical protein